MKKLLLLPLACLALSSCAEEGAVKAYVISDKNEREAKVEKDSISNIPWWGEEGQVQK